MLENIKASKIRVRWQLREVHKVTQWKDNCVYRTRSIGMISCDIDYAHALQRNPNIIVGSISTRISKLVNG